MAVHPLTQEPEPFSHMQQTIHAWGAVFMLLGGIAIILRILGSPFNPGVGIILLMVGGLAFYFDTEPALLIVYGTIFIWTGVVGILTMQTGRLIAAALGGSVAAMTLRSFAKHRRAQSDAPPARRAGRWFPQISLACGLTGSILFLADVMLYSMYGYWASPTVRWIMDDTQNTALRLAAPAVGFGIAALVCRFKKELASAIGILIGLVLTIWAITMRWPF